MLALSTKVKGLIANFAQPIKTFPPFVEFRQKDLYISKSNLIEIFLVRKIFIGKIMKQNCQHCGELIVGDAYWVTSEHEGIPLLDLIVCSLCSMEAKRLGLHTEEINARNKQVLARNRGNHPPRLGI